MADDFFARMDELIEQCGPGTVRSEVVVDQVYAKYQELRDDLELHGGGQHHYLRDSLYEELASVRKAWAETLVTPAGCEIRLGGERAAEVIAAGVYERAPFEFGDLKASPHPTASDNGQEYFDRPPAIHRLSEDELAAKGDLRRLGFGNRGAGDLDLTDEALG